MTLADLVPAGEDPAETVTLIKRLADVHLVVTSLNPTTGQEEVDVAHEALIRHWPRLRGWLREVGIRPNCGKISAKPRGIGSRMSGMTLTWFTAVGAWRCPGSTR